ncbi:MAG: hypothetical protein AAGA85_06565, partial [Bacteroidota bacterium]
PVAGHSPEGAIAIDININIVPRRLQLVGISPHVRIDRLLRDETQVSLVKSHHLRWQSENRQPIDPLMRKETPHFNWVGRMHQAKHQAQEEEFPKHDWTRGFQDNDNWKDEVKQYLIFISFGIPLRSFLE